MNKILCSGKIHRATVTHADLNYVGSITIDVALMEAAGVVEYERVQIVNINNGARFETYVITGERDSGIICLNGAASRLVQPGDKVIIMSYMSLSLEEIKGFSPKVVFVDERNTIISISDAIFSEKQSTQAVFVE